MGILVRALLLVVPLALASCYQPELQACSVACDRAIGCPSGMVCGAASMCVFEAADTCEAGEIDAGRIDAARPVSVQIVAYGGGRVVDQANGIDCGDSCSYQFESGTALVLRPAPDPSKRFERWTEDPCNEQGFDCSLTLEDAAIEATAKFRKD